MNDKNMKKRFNFIISCLILTVFFAVSIAAQTTAFNYQGKLSDGGNPASGNYLLQFKLFDAASGGTQIGSTVSDVSVTASQGVFSTQIDFGAPPFSGADRFLEIAVKKTAGDAYTPLSPRQQINSSPYSIRTLSAAQADVALDAQKLGGVAANQYATTTSVENSFIKNTTTPQAGANLNISGNGFFGGNVGIGTTIPTDKLNVKTLSNSYGITHTDGTVTVGTFISPAGGWLGTKSNHPLYFFTNDSAPQMTINTYGDIGIGTAPNSPANGKLVVQGNNGVGTYSFGSTGVIGYTNLSGGTGVLGTSSSGGFGVFSQGFLGVSVLGAAGSTALCRNASNQIANCSSSLRYKTDLHLFDGGLSIVNRLRPISFKWKADNTLDVGFGAEDVAKIEPMLITRNDKGEVEGVKYDRLSVVFVNAFKEQQAQITQQQRQIEQQNQQLEMQRQQINDLRKSFERLVKKLRLNGNTRR